MVLFGWVPFWVIGRFPRRWWLVLTGLWVPYAAFVTLVDAGLDRAAVQRLRPDEGPGTRAEIVDLAGRAGIPGSRVFEVNKSVDTKASNAYVNGLFGTKRIVLWDTLLADWTTARCSPWWGPRWAIMPLPRPAGTWRFRSVVVLAGLFWADRAGPVAAREDDAEAGSGSTRWRTSPPPPSPRPGSRRRYGPRPRRAWRYSRHHEREADRFSLDLTHANRSAAPAFADLQRHNLSVPYHSTLDTLFRDTHPSIGERIEFCNRYRPWASGR